MATKDSREPWLTDSCDPRREARGLLPLLRSMSAAEVVELIAVDDDAADFLDEFARENPHLRGKIEAVCAYRAAVLVEFQRLRRRPSRKYGS